MFFIPRLFRQQLCYGTFNTNLCKHWPGKSRHQAGEIKFKICFGSDSFCWYHFCCKVTDILLILVYMLSSFSTEECNVLHHLRYISISPIIQFIVFPIVNAFRNSANFSIGVIFHCIGQINILTIMTNIYYISFQNTCFLFRWFTKLDTKHWHHWWRRCFELLSGSLDV